eukprot:CAMPEP_0194180780 /NCGR_PEP_ID=MMETSP0154-20130528/18350_1 /TAXON_ID=1049557 /ORGANISM="Thalassiothrix antarctica, Strain L6-D1" /LENGTH=437 /DNA_ID=CAMNT_0038896559 /DNA_START=25 /DNA_END=1338 /DNA_ORIENTATION=+
MSALPPHLHPGNLPPPPPPPPVVGMLPPPPPPPIVGMPPPIVSNTTRPTSLPPSNVVLLTGVPSFLHQCLATWILPCGPTRTIVWYPKQLSLLEDEKTDNVSKSTISTMALVTMMHGDGAWKLVYTISKLREENSDSSIVIGNLKAHLVPASPDILLPPIIVEESIGNQIQAAMVKKYVELKGLGGKAIIEAKDPNYKSSFLSMAGGGTTSMMTTLPLDAQKVAAAAGGNNYDEDADPLNAPAVLKAVKEFREGLAKTSTIQQTRRMKLVEDRLQKAIKTLMTTTASSSLSQSAAMAPPPPHLSGIPPLAPPPMPGGLPPPPPQHQPTSDSGKRGQSNLPAWMTKQQQQMESIPPPQKKAKIIEDPINVLRPFIAQQIAHYMGEEEETLIDFILKHSVLEKKPIYPDLVTELQPILEEDTDAFLKALQTKLQQVGLV